MKTVVCTKNDIHKYLIAIRKDRARKFGFFQSCWRFFSPIDDEASSVKGAQLLHTFLMKYSKFNIILNMSGLYPYYNESSFFRIRSKTYLKDIAEAIHGTSVISINLNNMGLNADEIIAFIRKLKGTKVKYLSLCGNRIHKDKIAKIIEACQETMIETIDLTGYNMYAMTVLRSNMLSAEDVKQIGEMIKGTRIRKLKFSDPDLHDRILMFSVQYSKNIEVYQQCKLIERIARAYRLFRMPEVGIALAQVLNSNSIFFPNELMVKILQESGYSHDLLNTILEFYHSAFTIIEQNVKLKSRMGEIGATLAQVVNELNISVFPEEVIENILEKANYDSPSIQRASKGYLKAKDLINGRQSLDGQFKKMSL